MKPILLAIIACAFVGACASPNISTTTQTKPSDLALLSQQDGFIYQAENGKIKMVTEGTGDETVATLFAVNEQVQPIRRALAIGEIRQTIEEAGCSLPSSFAVTTMQSADLTAHEIGVVW